jgi:hypothetical protein
MYLQDPRDEHRICDSLSLRAHYSYERPDVSSSSLRSTLPMPFSPTLAPVARPISAVSQQRPFSTSLFNELARRIPARQVSGTLVPQPYRLTLRSQRPQSGEKHDLALSGAAATLASSSLAHTFTRQSRPLHRSRSDRAFPVTPVFEPLPSQV